jgi:Tripartite tricarboxylate transporter TctB family
MALSIRAPKDFWAGVIYFATGLAGFLIGQEYSFGSGARMGPGYFPSIISCLLIFFGVIAIFRSLMSDGTVISAFAWWAVMLVIGSVVAFALLINTAGLIAAISVLVLLSAAASEKFRFEWKATVGLVGLIAFCSLVFVKGLGVPIHLIGPWLKALLPAWLDV